MSKRIEARDSRVIKTQPATDGYRDGWERTFGKRQRTHEDPPRCGTCGYMHSWPSVADGSCSPVKGHRAYDHLMGAQKKECTDRDCEEFRDEHGNSFETAKACGSWCGCSAEKNSESEQLRKEMCTRCFHCSPCQTVDFCHKKLKPRKNCPEFWEHAMSHRGSVE